MINRLLEADPLSTQTLNKTLDILFVCFEYTIRISIIQGQSELLAYQYESVKNSQSPRPVTRTVDASI